jgi:hypothetical protein
MADTSKRERIMQHLTERFQARQAGVDGALITWNMVTRKPISRTEVGMGDTLGIFDVRETKDPVMQHMVCELTVIFEFYCALMLGDEPSTELNRMLLDVQRTIRTDIYCSGLSLNIVESKNELDIDGPTDSLVAGVIEVTVLYRHLVDDPSA